MRRFESRGKALDNTEFLLCCGLENVPALFVGLADDWSGRQRWGWAALRNEEREVDVTLDGVFVERCSAADFSRRVHAGTSGRSYAKDATLHLLENGWRQNFPAPECWENWLADDGDLPDKHPRLARPHFPDWSWLYFGGEGSSSPIHVDLFESSAYNALLEGEKLWIFFPDDCGQLLSLGNDEFKMAFDPTDESVPFHRAVVVLQKGGDIVFTPSGWYHAVLNVKASVAITENFVNESNFLFVLRNLTRARDSADSELRDQLGCVMESLVRSSAARLRLLRGEKSN